ncbi:hypothetical protein ACHAPW_008691 [Verticillium nonalfalfae]
MADPLSVIGVVFTTAQATKTLYQTVQSFRDQPRAVRQLRDELKSLDGVLDSLYDAVEQEEMFFLPLQLPLRQCGKACSEFEALVVKCTTHSDGAWPSVRDWMRLRYMDADIRGFTEMLAGYKSTMSVALAYANLRSSKITRAALDEYQDMIKATTQDLESHLEDINRKLHSLTSLGDQQPADNAEERQWFERERQSTQQCLDICAQGITQLVEARKRYKDGAHTAMEAEQLTLAELVTLLALRRCQDDLAIHLRAKEEQAGRSQSLPVHHRQAALPTSSPETQAFLHESHSTEQCLAVLHRAAEQASSSGVHVVEDVDIGNDAQQMLITSRDQLFEARRIKLGSRAKQFIMSTTSEELQDFLKSQRRM